MNIQEYFDRVDFKGKIEIDEDCLKELHKCHIMAIPFESLDVQLGKRIDLNLNKIYNKVIKRNRGGYCYELNFLFHTLLTKIGFKNSMISAKIYDNNRFGPEFDHMAIIVKLKELWLADVGFGDLFLEPIQIKTGHQQHDKFKTYDIALLNPDEYVLSELLQDKLEFQKKYKFNITPRFINDFEEQNNWKQTSKESYFVKNRICTLPTENGRKTIFNNIYKTRTNAETKLIEIEGESRFIEILKKEFNIVLEKTS